MNTLTRTQELINKLRTETDPKFADDMNKVADSLDRMLKGAVKGGKARAKKLTKSQRSEIARRAAQIRWARQKESERPKDSGLRKTRRKRLDRDSGAEGHNGVWGT